MNKYFVIVYKFSTWTRTHPYGMSLADAQEFAKAYENTNIVHEMWMDCLDI